MKKLSLYSVLFCATISTIQAQNPFASIGKTTKPMLTLSNGRYDEFFENDSIRQVGSVMVNIHSEKIVAFVDRKVQANKLHSQSTSRFLSLDPLARQFPFLTPYQFAGNKPISSIDLDGLEDLDYRVLGILANGNALVQVFTSEGSTAFSHKGVTEVHNINTGESKKQFSYNELKPIISNGYVVDKGDRNATNSPKDDKGSSNYYFSVNNQAFSDNLIKMNNGNQIDEDGNVKFKSGVFEVKPITPTGNESSQYNTLSGVAGMQNSLLQSIESIVTNQIKTAAPNQGANEVLKITLDYDVKFNEIFTDAFKQTIQTTYPNAKIEYKALGNDGMDRQINNTSVTTTVEGTPYHEE